MKQDLKHLFHSKILLFGEYSLMLGSMALSVPFKLFSGRFVFDSDWQNTDAGKNSNFQLEKFADYLESILDKPEQQFIIDAKKFTKDISSGLVFQSNIPQGYGLGSSGALVAAVYVAYGEPLLQDFTELKIIGLKNFLAWMESYFHGKSSGLDPLIGYLKKPLLIEIDGKIEMPVMPKWSDTNQGAVFLVDSGASGETQPLVKQFINWSNNESYLEKIKSEYIPVVNSCICAYRDADIEKLFENLELLSDFQYKNFEPMISSTMKPIWKNGLKTGKYLLKLCGSGGGGMVLGFSRDFEIAKHELKDYPITKVHSI